jgi:3-oxocholest-4-en-26-oate---CoA ligase
LRSPTDHDRVGITDVTRSVTTPKVGVLHFADLFEILADEFATETALVHVSGGVDGRRLTWQEYENEAARFANFLADNGVGAGQKVGLFLHNGPEYLIAQFGAFKQRAIPININYRYQAREIEYLIDNADLDVVVFHGSLGERIAAVQSTTAAERVRAWIQVDDRGERGTSTTPTGALNWEDLIGAQVPAPRIERSEDDRYFLYTGGTTGMPKGVVFRMGDIVARMFTGYFYRGWALPNGANDVVAQARLHAENGDRRVSVVGCPLMHGTGMWLGAFYAHLMGGTTVTLASRGFDPDALWAAVQHQRADAVTIVGDSFAVPLLAALDAAVVAGRPYDLTSLTMIQSSGVMLSAESQARFLAYVDVRIVDSMGSTEGGMARRIATRNTPIETATFELIAGTKLITDDGRVVQPGSGEVGRIAASAVVPLEYFKDEKKSAETFVLIDGVRHAMAGDYASLNSDGSLVLLGRGSNCINTAGEKVFPEEVEESLKRHSDVVDCLVVGIESSGSFGQEVAAVVSLSEGSTAHTDDLKHHVRADLAGYKVPRMIKVVPRVERSAAGKADYQWAVRLFAVTTKPASDPG